jgi:hypothetical protein
MIVLNLANDHIGLAGDRHIKGLQSIADSAHRSSRNQLRNRNAPAPLRVHFSG